MSESITRDGTCPVCGTPISPHYDLLERLEKAEQQLKEADWPLQFSVPVFAENKERIEWVSRYNAFLAARKDSGT